jgi:DNA-directed RNA polymerase subunit RPC12/RpoP
MNKKPNVSGIAPPSLTGGPYAYVCLACNHRFMRAFPLGLFCPACKSLRVVRDPNICY